MKFQKGQSGNPAGRKKTDPEFDNIVKKHGHRAVALIADFMESAAEDSIRLKAAIWLAERAFGKPTQPSEISETNKGSIVVQYSPRTNPS